MSEAIPAELGGLPGLTFLGLANNRFTGELPEQRHSF